MKILVATDAWHPQVNGVVRTLVMMAKAARGLGVEIDFLTPDSFRTFALPSYRDLRLALPGPSKIAELIERAAPDSIHIATEGPIGFMVRRYCRKYRSWTRCATTPVSASRIFPSTRISIRWARAR